MKLYLGLLLVFLLTGIIYIKFN